MALTTDASGGFSSLNLFNFRKDRANTFSTGGPLTSAFSSLKARLTRPKPLPDGPKVSKEMLTAKAKAMPKAPSNAPQVQQPTTGTQASGTTIAPVSTQVTVSQTDKVHELTSKYQGEIAKFSKRVSDYTEKVVENGQAEKPSMKEHARLTGEKIELLAGIEKELAKFEEDGKGHLSNKDVAQMREQLVGLLVDLAFPEAAVKREFDSALILKPSDDLIGAHRDFVKLLADLRSNLSPANAASLTGSFLDEVSRMPLLSRSGLSQHDRVETASSLVSAFSKGEISFASVPQLNTTSPSVKAVLSEFRAVHHENDAARNFLAKLNDQNELPTGISKAEIGTLTASEIRAKLDPNDTKLQADFKTAVDGGRATAKLRDDYEAQRDRTAKALGPEKMQLVEASIQMMAKGVITGFEKDKGIVWTMPPEVTKLLTQLAKTNSEAAFQVARLADSMEKLTEAQDKNLGHNQMGMDPGKKFSADEFLKLTGVTRKDIESMGYDFDTVKGNFQENMSRLGKAGFSGVDDVTHAVDRMRAAKSTLENRDVQDNLQSDLAKQPSVVGQLMLNEISSDARSTVKEHLDQGDLATGRTEAQTQAFTGISQSVQETLFRPDNWTGDKASFSNLGQELEALQGKVNFCDLQGVWIAEDIQRIESNVADHQKVLRDYATAKHGKLDLEKPEGLKSAKIILDVVKLDTAIKNLPDNETRRAFIKERDELRTQLKGFDASSLKRTWIGKSPFSSEKPPSLEQIKDFYEQAKAIVYLRETAPNLLAEKRVAQSKLPSARNALLKERYEKAPNLFAAMDRMIHAAVVSKIDFNAKPTTGEEAYNPTYDMRGKKDEIVAQLKTWGMDTDRFAVEIDRAISSPITGDTLLAWRARDTNGSFGELLETAAVDTVKKPMSSRIKEFGESALLMLANKSRVDEQMRDELGVLIDKMPSGGKFDLMSGTEIKLNTGRIPVEPTGTVTVRGRLSGSIFDNFTIEVGSNNEIKLIGLFGGTVKAGVDLQAGWKLFEQEIAGPKGKMDIKLAATLSGDVGYEGAEGVQITFPPGAEGRKQAIEAIMKLTERQKPSASIFENANDVMDVRRHKGDASLKSDIGGKLNFGWQPSEDGDVLGNTSGTGGIKSGSKNGVGIGISAGITGNAGIGGKTERYVGLDKTVVKSEYQTTVGVSAKATVNVQVFTLLGLAENQALTRTGAQSSADKDFHTSDNKGLWSGGDATSSEDLLSLGVSVSVTQIHKKKMEFDNVGPDGTEVLSKIELKELTDGANTKSGNDLAAIFNGVDIPKLDKARREQLRSMFDQMARLGHSNAMIEMTYTLSGPNLKLVQSLHKDARDAELAGNKSEAKALMAAAQRIIDDRDSYDPDKVVLLDKTGVKGSANRGNAALVSLDIVSNTGVERPMMTVSLKV